ncbi:MAG: hypothetical protein GXP49_01025 [Deltaproteobacteria bacterium]|nr:hypothetical protein [Deltaproteobacteria bacterium]
MTRRTAFMFASVCSVVFAACGPGPGADVSSTRRAALNSIQYDGTGIHSIVWNGVNILEGVGGYYVIGSCTGADSEDQNVISLGSDGKTLHAPGVCPGAPFSIQLTGNNPVHAKITVGPLPVDYRSLSVPFDPTMAYFDRFRISSSGYLVGCANTWSPRSGSGGPFSDIPQPCTIPGHGAVGVARVTKVGPGWWGEISGSVVTVRRTIVGGNIKEGVFINHPYTHNMELSFQVEPVSQHILPKGSTYTLEEDISFRDPGDEPTEDAEFVSADIPDKVSARSEVEVNVTMRNSGETTWTEPADHMGGTRLGSLADNQFVWIPGAAGGYRNNPGDQRLYLASSVAPGQEVTFTFKLQTPDTQGTYTFGARMVHDGVAWFGPEIKRTIEVTNDPCGGGPINGCGGCGTLDHSPGGSCGECGTYVCDGVDAVKCVDPGKNACGGCKALSASPGDACGTCGKYECNGQDALRCNEGSINGCGGCGTLDHSPGGSCGECGTYVCDGVDAVKCDDPGKNACGGCKTLAVSPGDECGECGTYVCDGVDAVKCDDPGANTCGGCTGLDHDPGMPCGTCGKYICKGTDEVECQDPGLNECGECGDVPPDGCGSGDDDGSSSSSGCTAIGGGDLALPLLITLLALVGPGLRRRNRG